MQPAEFWKKDKIILYFFSVLKYNPIINRKRKGTMIMKKWMAFLLAAAMVCMLFTGCGKASGTDSDLAYVQDKGVLVVGITEYAPMDYRDENGQWTGFDAEFAQLFAEKLGVKCEFYLIADWTKKFVELDTKQIDVVWNGMTICDDALSNSSVSDPYVINAQVVVMKADAVGNYKTPESLSGLSVAVENGSVGQTAANAIAGAKVIPVGDQAAALLEVKSGAADACVIDITMAYAMTGEGTNYADLAPGLKLTEEFYGVSFRKGSDMTAMLNEFMAELKENGTLQDMADRYKLTLAE